MREKLIQLALALAVLAAASMSSVPTAEGACPRYCCPDGGPCYTCCRPCPIQCP